MIRSADQLAKGPANQRGQIAAAIAASIDKVPHIERSKSLMLSTLYPGGESMGSCCRRNTSPSTS